jgi:hypothetical protein
VWKRKKVVLLVAVAVAVLISGVVAGVTLAQSGNGNVNGNETNANTQYQTFLNKVATIYQQNTGVTIDPQQLETAFTQAQKEMQSEALQTWFQNLVTQGKITQAQADQYLQWWNSKPDVPLLGLPRGGGMMWGRGHGCWGGNYTIPEAPGS